MLRQLHGDQFEFQLDFLITKNFVAFLGYSAFHQKEGRKGFLCMDNFLSFPALRQSA